MLTNKISDFRENQQIESLKNRYLSVVIVFKNEFATDRKDTFLSTICRNSKNSG